MIRSRRLAGQSLDDALREPDSRLRYPLTSIQGAIRRGWAQVNLPVA